MKTVCLKHQQAYEVSSKCPWCVPEVKAPRNRLAPYTRHEALHVIMVFNMMDQWEARLCLDDMESRVLEVGVNFYEFSTDPQENVVGTFLETLHEHLEKTWGSDKGMFLVQNISTPRNPGEQNICLFLTQEGVEVGITDQYRFFLSDSSISVEACNPLNISYINKSVTRDFYRALTSTVISDLGLRLTVV